MKLEMRTLKNISAAAMTLAVVFGAASLKPVTANAAEASVSASIEEENSYISFQDEAYQNEFLRRVNNERAKAGLKPVQLGDSSHNNAAQERAKELASSYSYVRPNGQRDFTIFAENGIEDVSIGEDYMAGVSTPDAAVDQWMNIDFTRERILNADATTMSVGHYEGGVYNNYWVLIFSCPENSYASNYRQEVLNLVNAERAKYGLQHLGPSVDPALYEVIICFLLTKDRLSCKAWPIFCCAFFWQRTCGQQYRELALTQKRMRQWLHNGRFMLYLF